MLKRNEEAVLNTILNNAYKNESCLITLPNIVAFIGNEKLVSNENIKSIIEKLSASDYIDFLVVNNNGEETYCITILKKGRNYSVEKKTEIAQIKRKVLLAVMGAVISFIVGKILFYLF